MTRQQILKEIKRRVLEIVPDAQVWLYGSQARGDFDDNSDWDILVITKQEIPMPVRMKIIDNLSDIGIELGEVFNPLILSEAIFEKFKQDIFLQNVRAEKIVL